MHIDFKITTWERLELDLLSEEQQNEILQKVKDGKITSIQDVYDEYSDDLLSWERIIESDENMKPEENDGQSTIEVYKDIMTNPIWTNEIKK